MIRQTLTGIVFVTIFAGTVPAGDSVALIADRSGSMSGKKLVHLKEGAKLAMALLDGDLHVIAFGGTAQSSPSFSLSSPESRHKAMAYVDALGTGGGTSYPAALRELNMLPKGTVAIFISDGENTDGTDQRVLQLVDKSPGPIHTIAVKAGRSAKELLQKMAARSGASAVAIDKSEQLTNTILEIAQSLSHYRSHTPRETNLQFPGIQGDAIAIGYDADVKMDGNPQFSSPPFRHCAKLPGEHVIVSRVTLEGKTDLHIQMLKPRSPNGHLARVLRNDQPCARMTLDTVDGTVATGSEITAKTELFDNDGNQLDPRNRPDFLTVFALQNEEKQTLLKVPAKPSPSTPSLGATIPVPNKAGPVTVVQGSRIITTSGHAFDSFERQTVIAQERLQLVARPAVLTETVETGRFQVSLTLESHDHKATIPEEFEASLNTTSSAITLVQSTAADGAVTFVFDATKEGDVTGTVTLTDASVGGFAPLCIPFRFTITPKYLGLKLPKGMDFGAFSANSGTVPLKSISVSSLDDRSASYRVEVTDLSNGTHILPLQPSLTSISPTKAKPASLGFTAEIGDAPFGAYTGTATFALSATIPPRTWELPLQVVILDPLVASPADFGVVAPGMICEGTLVLRNTGADLGNVQITAEDIQAKGGLIELSLPNAAFNLRSNAETSIPLKLSLSPLVSSRGPHEATIRIQRTSGVETTVPVRLTIEDNAPGSLVVSPARLSVIGKPRTVAQFNFSVKLGSAVSGAEELSVRATELTAANGMSTDSAPEFQWTNGNAITRDKPASAKAFLVAPSAPGTYRGEIVIESKHSGTKTVPLAFNVR